MLLDQLIFLLRHFAKIHSDSFHQHPQSLSTLQASIWVIEEATEETCLLPICKAAWELLAQKGIPLFPVPGAWLGVLDKQASPAPMVMQASLQMKTEYWRKFRSALWTLVIQEATKLGNAGEGKIVLKDLGRIMPLGNAWIFFFFLILSLDSNKSETHWKI